ncbi:hypothetical protein CBW46_018340 [Paenibacillus xerothermodurans]|uniref:DUF1572 domain-containing protein n=1 Tax=Paenibacillus xerothermodurans TaxID=1977292 RepID=A0A2W1N541_PAEXE|nr:hypothetical protein CBW46_018340 [Paenibacillus xerothermodurans]
MDRPVEIHFSQLDWNRMKQRDVTEEGDATFKTYPSISALLLHVAQHYGYHTGQIVFITKVMHSQSASDYGF